MGISSPCATESAKELLTGFARDWDSRTKVIFTTRLIGSVGLATLRLVHIIIIQTLGTRVVQCFQGLLIMVDIYSTDFSGRPREGSGMLFLFWAEL